MFGVLISDLTFSNWTLTLSRPFVWELLLICHLVPFLYKKNFNCQAIECSVAWQKVHKKLLFLYQLRARFFMEQRWLIFFVHLSISYKVFAVSWFVIHEYNKIKKLDCSFLSFCWQSAIIFWYTFPFLLKHDADKSRVLKHTKKECEFSTCTYSMNPKPSFDKQGEYFTQHNLFILLVSLL
jgi:hypothetical protein